jgi:hypothetical protein
LCPHILITPPTGLVERGKYGLICVRERRRFLLGALALSQSAKFVTGDRVTKVESFGISR